MEVNGSLEPGSYEISEGDVVETRNFYTVGQVAEFMDIDIDTDQQILVNNREAGLDTLVYENFSIDWTTEGFGVAQETDNRYNATETTEEAGTGQEGKKEVQIPSMQEDTEICTVTVNGERVELIGKKSYIFVDIFDRITFDLTAGRGRAIATLVNGKNAEFSQELHEGDRIELYWKEN